MPETLFDVAQREKEIRYSSRTRLATDSYAHSQTIRRTVRKMLERMPPRAVRQSRGQAPVGVVRRRCRHHHRAPRPPPRRLRDARAGLRVLAPVGGGALECGPRRRETHAAPSQVAAARTAHRGRAGARPCRRLSAGGIVRDLPPYGTRRHANASELEHRQGLGLVAARAAPAAGRGCRRPGDDRQRRLRPRRHARRAPRAGRGPGRGGRACRCMCWRSRIPASNEEYERVMGAFVARQVAEGIEAMAFGDLFLEDIRRYRETQAGRHRHHAAVPAVGHRDGRLARTMIAGGLEAYVTCVDPRKLPPQLRRPRFDAALLARFAGGRRPLRRERRVPHLRLSRPDVPLAHCRTSRRDRHPRRLRVLRSGSSRHHPREGGGRASRLLRTDSGVDARLHEHDGRIVSLIASATEIVCALGRRDRLVGAATSATSRPTCGQLPALTAPKFKVEGTSAEIDAARARHRARRAVGLSRRRGGAATRSRPT